MCLHCWGLLPVTLQLLSVRSWGLHPQKNKTSVHPYTITHHPPIYGRIQTKVLFLHFSSTSTMGAAYTIFGKQVQPHIVRTSWIVSSPSIRLLIPALHLDFGFCGFDCRLAKTEVCWSHYSSSSCFCLERRGIRLGKDHQVRTSFNCSVYIY